MPKHQPKITFVALDENWMNDGFETFSKLNAFEAIEWVRKRIIYVCEQLKHSAPGDMWIIAWKEYGITGGAGKRAISPQAKAKFKKTMLELTRQYPNLTIVAGTVQTYKQYNDPAVLNKIRSYYNFHGYIKQEERRFTPSRQYFKNEKDELIKYENKFPPGGIQVVRNSCFVFHDNTCQCHDKVAPVGEVNHSCTDLPNPLFQPANAKRKNPIFKLKHPVSKVPVTLGIEICNEHTFSYLQHEDHNNKTFLHLIVSNYIDIHFRSLQGKYVIQLDIRKKPRLILSREEQPAKLPIRYYQTNMCSDTDILHGPLQPLYPFTRCVLDKLDAVIKHLPKDDRRIALTTIRDNFYRQAVENFQCNSDAILDFLQVLIEANTSFFRNEKRTFVLRLFHKDPNLPQLYAELLYMISKEKVLNPVYNDYQSIEDARPLSI